MCRHIGYIGKERLLSDIFLNKSHSLIDMAFKPREMENAKLNADGFGIGSLVDIGRPIVFMGLSKGLGTIFRQFAFGNAKHLKALGAANRQLRSFMVGNEINQQILISSMTNVNMNEKTGTMLETIISDANNAMFMANGLSNWNQFIKRAVGVSVVDVIIENANLAAAGKLPKANRDQMLKLHLDENDLITIAVDLAIT